MGGIIAMGVSGCWQGGRVGVGSTELVCVGWGMAACAVLEGSAMDVFVAHAVNTTADTT